CDTSVECSKHLRTVAKENPSAKIGEAWQSKVIRILSAASATLRTRGTTETWWLIHSTSNLLQYAGSPSAVTCASGTPFSAARVKPQSSDGSRPAVRGVESPLP